MVFSSKRIYSIRCSYYVYIYIVEKDCPFKLVYVNIEGVLELDFFQNPPDGV